MKPRPLAPPSLENDVVRVRALEDRDAPAYAAAFRDDPALGRLAGFDPEPDEEWVRARAGDAAVHAAKGDWLQLVIAEPDDDGFAGDVILHHVDWRHEKAEIGFWVAPDARGRGLASEAVRLLLRWTFDEAALHRIELKTLPENAGALALAKRLGFTREGLLRECAVERGVRVSLELWSLLAADRAAERL